MPFITLTPNEFQHHCSLATEKSFLQSIEMANLLTKRGFTVEYVGYKADGDIKVSALLYTKSMFGGFHMEINSGPVCTDEQYLTDFYQGLTDYAKKNKALQVLVKPYATYQQFDTNGQATSPEKREIIELLTTLGFHHDGLQTGYPGGEPDWHYLKDISQLTKETLTSSYSKKGKALIKKANSFGIVLSQLNRDQLQLFKDITSATSERRDYSDKSLEYYQDFYDTFGDKAEFMLASINFQNYLEQLQASQEQLIDKINQLKEQYQNNLTSPKFNRMLKELTSQSETFDVRQDEARELIATYGQSDIPLAVSLFVYDDKEAIYLFSGSLPEFNKFYAPALLQEHAMQTAINRQIPLYNLLGITGEFDGTDGVLRFKQNFNGYINRKTGTFRYYPKPITFKLIRLVKKLLRR